MKPRARQTWMYEDDIKLAKINAAKNGVPMMKYMRQLLREQNGEMEPPKRRRDDIRLF